MNDHQEKLKPQSIVQVVGKEDINFPEFVLGVLDKNSNKESKKEIIFHDPLYPDKKIGVVPSIFGFPTQLTRDLYRALMRLTYLKNRFHSSKIDCTLREICREMGIKVSGQMTAKIRESLDILAGTQVKFYHSYYNLESKDLIDEVTSIGILDGYTLREFNKKGDKKMDQEKLQNSIKWSPSFWDLSLKEAKNLINYDYSFYISLNGNITKELYIFLNKRAFNKKFFKIPIRILAFEKLGMSRTLSDKLFKVRQQLRKAHQELLEKGFFDSEPRFVKTSSDEWVHYSFSVRHKIGVDETEPGFLEQTLLVFDEEQEKLKDNLKKIGFTEGQIGKMFDRHSIDFLRDGIDLLGITENIKNPRNWFWGYLKGDYDTDTLHQHRQSQQEEEKKRKEEEEKRQKEEQKEQEKAEQSAKQKAEINDWISKNTLKWIEMCENYLKNELKTDSRFFYDRVMATAKKQGKTPVEVFMSNEMYNYKVRATVWEILNQ